MHQTNMSKETLNCILADSVLHETESKIVAACASVTLGMVFI